MTLLEEWTDAKQSGTISVAYVHYERIRRAIAIAQAVEEIDNENFGSLSVVYRRADELLK